MTFKSQMAADAVNVFCNTGDFAESCSYQPVAGGDPVAVTAEITRREISVDYQVEGEYSMRIAVIAIPKSQLASAPERLDIITDAGGVMWVITGTKAEDESVYVLNAKRHSRSTQGSLNEK